METPVSSEGNLPNFKVIVPSRIATIAPRAAIATIACTSLLIPRLHQVQQDEKRSKLFKIQVQSYIVAA